MGTRDGVAAPDDGQGRQVLQARGRERRLLAEPGHEPGPQRREPLPRVPDLHPIALQVGGQSRQQALPAPFQRGLLARHALGQKARQALALAGYDLLANAVMAFMACAATVLTLLSTAFVRPRLHARRRRK